MCFSQNQVFRKLIGRPSIVEYGRHDFILKTLRDLADKHPKVLDLFLYLWVHY